MENTEREYVKQKTAAVLQKHAKLLQEEPIREEAMVEMRKIAKEVIASAPATDLRANAVYLVGHQEGYQSGMAEGYIKGASEAVGHYYDLFMNKLASVINDQGVMQKVAAEMDAMDADVEAQVNEIMEASKEVAVQEIAEQFGGPEALEQAITEDPALGDQIDQLTDQVAEETAMQILEEVNAPGAEGGQSAEVQPQM